MTPENAVKAGQLVVQRNLLRELFRTGQIVTIQTGIPSGNIVLRLDTRGTKAALDAVDLDYSNRLEKLGISEL